MSSMTGVKRTKNQIRREKKKIQKKKKSDDFKISNETCEDGEKKVKKEEFDEKKIYENLDKSELFLKYQNIFLKYEEKVEEKKEDIIALKKNSDLETNEEKKEQFYNSSFEKVNKKNENKFIVSENENGIDENSNIIENKKNKILLYQLKTVTIRPELISWYDADGKDPYFFVFLKSQVNAIQVPAHWLSNKDYLSSRKSIEKTMFQLPEYLKDTCIQNIRRVEDLTLRQHQRERVQPKIGKLDVDYQKLYDAFFKNQTKPPLSVFGDIYFEGKTKNCSELIDIVPGKISAKLLKALDMSIENTKIPPPWIPMMNELGKPWSYRNLIIPSLDCEYSNTGYKDQHLTLSSKPKTTYWGSFMYHEMTSDDSSDDGSDSSIQSSTKKKKF